MVVGFGVVVRGLVCVTVVTEFKASIVGAPIFVVSGTEVVVVFRTGFFVVDGTTLDEVVNVVSKITNTTQY